jgi:hypothetical protein
MTTKKISIFGFSSIILASLFFVLVLSQGVFAASFDAELKNINFRISPDEVATYNVTVTNYLETEGRYDFRLSLGDSIGWMSSPSTIVVPPMSSRTIVLRIWPKPSTAIGVYTLNMAVQSQIFDESRNVQIPVHISYDGAFFDFVPNVETSLSVPESLDPRSSARIIVKLKNRNPLNLENVEVRVISDLFKGQETIDIGPLQDVPAKEFIFQMDPLQRPGEYEVVAQVYYPRTDRVISQERATVSVVGYSSTPSKLETTRSNLFVVTNIITVENFGNRDATAEVKLAAGWFKKAFSSTNPKAEYVTIDGESSFLWNPVLEPTEQKTIIVRTNYWPLVLSIVFAVVLLFSYFSLRSPIVIEKEAAVIDEDVGEGSSDIRIRLFVRNRSGNSVKNIIISDKVSGITDYVESNQLGHVKPSRVTKTSKKGTLLYWDIDELEPFEERIFTYKLKSKLKVVGDLTLPKAKAKFEFGNNKERNILSEAPFFRKSKVKKAE